MNHPLASYLDAAILKPEMTRREVSDALLHCVQLGVCTVCVRPCDIVIAQEACAGTRTGVCVVLGFPHGDQLPESKVDEVRRYLALGVQEIDMVCNFGWVRSGLWDLVRDEISAVAALTQPASVLLKVIFETSQVTLNDVTRLVEICVEARADFVKTSTGFNGPGASDAVVQQMLQTANGRIRVKPSGGIRDQQRAEALLAMGAHRLGVGYSACEAICGGGIAVSDAY